MQQTGVHRGLPGSALKIIAIVCMIIDHIAAVVLDRVLMSRGMAAAYESAATAEQFLQANGTLYYIDMIMRLIGRISFPLFIFLLIQGFLHTSNVRRYAVRLFGFALLSEVPFDLAVHNQFFDLGGQNIFWTLVIGLLVIIGMRACAQNAGWHKVPRVLLQLLIVAVGMAAGALLRVDYGAFGVLAVAAMYLLECRHKRLLSAAAGCTVLTAMSPISLPAFFSLIPIRLYNGERGWSLKYFFYLFYPLHLLALYLLAVALGLGAVSPLV